MHRTMNILPRAERLVFCQGGDTIQAGQVLGGFWTQVGFEKTVFLAINPSHELTPAFSRLELCSRRVLLMSLYFFPTFDCRARFPLFRLQGTWILRNTWWCLRWDTWRRQGLRNFPKLITYSRTNYSRTTSNLITFTHYVEACTTSIKAKIHTVAADEDGIIS